MIGKGKEKRCMCACMLCRVQLFVTSWTITRQAPLSMGSSRQEYWAISLQLIKINEKKKKEYWTKLLWPPSEDLPEPGMEPASSALVGVFFTIRPPRKPWRKRWRWKIEEKNFFSNPQLSGFTFLTSKENSQINKFDSPRLTMVQLVIFFFLPLWWCESYTHLIETALWILILTQSCHMLYDTGQKQL